MGWLYFDFGLEVACDLVFVLLCLACYLVDCLFGLLIDCVYWLRYCLFECCCMILFVVVFN